MLVFVLHFSLGQRGTTIETPVNGLEALVEIAIFKHLSQRANLVGFGTEVHGQVGVIPIAQHTESDKVLFLTRDLLSRVSAA